MCIAGYKDGFLFTNNKELDEQSYASNFTKSMEEGYSSYYKR